jgi:hypothetical protein
MLAALAAVALVVGSIGATVSMGQSAPQTGQQTNKTVVDIQTAGTASPFEN